MAFNETVNRFAFHSENAGKLEDATHTGVAGTPGAGKYIKIHLRVEDDLILEAKWEANGCPASMSCAAVVCAVVCGKLLNSVSNITSNDVIVMLQGLPEGKEPMAKMAVTALEEALKSEIQNE